MLVMVMTQSDLMMVPALPKSPVTLVPLWFLERLYFQFQGEL
jgi:hypothetical protein